jgi:hypothetical protein
MRLFIKLTISFILALLGMILIVENITNYIVAENSNFKLDSNPKYIVTGHSHPQCAFNDSLIVDFQNISQSGESYFYTYFKTKQIIEQNASIKVVFIEYTNNQINARMDDWIWGNTYMSSRYPKYAPYMSLADKRLLFFKNHSGYLNSYSFSVKNNLERIFKKDYSYSKLDGGYVSVIRDKTDSLVANKVYNERKSITNLSETNLFYLSLLIEFCNQKGVDIILIRSPQHEAYEGYFNELKYKEILKKKYSNFDYIDFSNFPVTNSEFGDLEHLNYKGAKVFSEFFAKLLDEGLLEEKEKGEFVQQKIKALTNNNSYKN